MMYGEHVCFRGKFFDLRKCGPDTDYIKIYHTDWKLQNAKMRKHISDNHITQYELVPISAKRNTTKAEDGQQAPKK